MPTDENMVQLEIIFRWKGPPFSFTAKPMAEKILFRHRPAIPITRPQVRIHLFKHLNGRLEIHKPTIDATLHGLEAPLVAMRIAIPIV